MRNWLTIASSIGLIWSCELTPFSLTHLRESPGALDQNHTKATICFYLLLSDTFRIIVLWRFPRLIYFFHQMANYDRLLVFLCFFKRYIEHVKLLWTKIQIVKGQKLTDIYNSITSTKLPWFYVPMLLNHAHSRMITIDALPFFFNKRSHNPQLRNPHLIL